MSDCVPEFQEIEDAYQIPTPSGFHRHKKPTKGTEEDFMELLWQNGPVVAQISSKKNSFLSGGAGVEAAKQPVVREIRPSNEEHLFMQEDEMASWLQYPIDDSSFDRDLYSDLLSSAPPPQPPVAATIAPPRPPPENSPRLQNFGHFSRIPSRPRMDPMPKASVTTAVDSAVVESSTTPSVRPESRVSHTVPENIETRAADDRKRKGREPDDNESHSEDIEFEAKKQSRGSGSTKRSRAAEVHNLSERKRRDRINEKMKALQELIPRCNKADKASMLDEAIEYLKSLQLQVQMMSMGCGMVPMMYPGMQQYMPTMGMGMGMGLGMGMGMDMGMNRPMVPYPSMAIPNPAAAAAAHVDPRFHMPPVPLTDPLRTPASNQADPLRMPNFVDPYQQFLGLHQAQMPPLPQQNQAMMQQPSANKPSTSKEIGNPVHQQYGRKS